MKAMNPWIAAALVALAWPGAAALPEPQRPEEMARDAVSRNAAVARRGRARLREMGPEGLDALLAAHAGEIRRMGAALAGGEAARPEWSRLRAALESVAAQRDAHRAGLYWFTDLARARQRASATARPILSLRLLGRLDEELSCANSRFFRTALYANRTVAKALRDGWVLHWQSVREAPRIEVDYGGGRKLVRTITGNSLHLVLTSDGQAVDALPGLYGPQAFLAELEKAGAAAREVVAVDSSVRAAAVRRYHQWRLRQPESPILARLDESSRALMAEKTRGVHSGEALSRVILGFERALAEDTARNQRELHPVIHRWFAGGEAPAEAGALVERIYDEVFLTPGGDPWMGLVAPDSYAALDGEGLGAPPPGGLATPPPAQLAGALATTKAIVEMPMVRALTPGRRVAVR